MTVQIDANLQIDAGDFQATVNNTHIALKIRWVPSEDVNLITLSAYEQTTSGWQLSKLLLTDLENQTTNVPAYMTNRVVPAVNTWLQGRFGANGAGPTPITVPDYVKAIDKELLGLRLVIGADGVPRVTYTQVDPV